MTRLNKGMKIFSWDECVEGYFGVYEGVLK